MSLGVDTLLNMITVPLLPPPSFSKGVFIFFFLLEYGPSVDGPSSRKKLTDHILGKLTDHILGKRKKITMIPSGTPTDEPTDWGSPNGRPTS